MASSNHLTRLLNIRDNLEKAVEDELARVAALTAAGHPPPVSYSVSGKSVSWTDWYRSMLEQIQKMNDYIIAAGGDSGGIPEVSIVVR